MSNFAIEFVAFSADQNVTVAASSGNAQPVAVEAQNVIEVPGEVVAVENAPAPQQNSWLGSLPLLIGGVLIIFLMMRSSKKQNQKRQELLSQIKKGDRVMTASGIFGTIQEVKDQTYILEIADKVRIEVIKTAVAQTVKSDAGDTTVAKA